MDKAEISPYSPTHFIEAGDKNQDAILLHTGKNQIENKAVTNYKEDYEKLIKIIEPKNDPSLNHWNFLHIVKILIYGHR